MTFLLSLSSTKRNLFLAKAKEADKLAAQTRRLNMGSTKPQQLTAAPDDVKPGIIALSGTPDAEMIKLLRSMQRTKEDQRAAVEALTAHLAASQRS